MSFTNDDIIQRKQKVIAEYMFLMQDLTDDNAMRSRFLDNPAANQQEIRTSLREHSVGVPDNAFLSFDMTSKDIKVVITRKPDSQVTLKQCVALEDANMTEVFFYQADGSYEHQSRAKQPGTWDEINLPGGTTEYDIHIIFPFFIMTSYEIKFNNQTEIILSSC